MNGSSFSPPVRPLGVPVCQRCRNRKQKCNVVLNPCANCVAAGVECLIFDPTTQQSLPRAYVQSLEAHVSELRQRLSLRRDQRRGEVGELGRAFTLPPHEYPPGVEADGGAEDGEKSMDEARGRYLGPTSGITFIESAIRLAQAKGILDEDTDKDAQEMDDVAMPETDSHADILADLLPTARIQPLPGREKMERLFDALPGAQWQFAIMERHEFASHLDQFYGSSGDSGNSNNGNNGNNDNNSNYRDATSTLAVYMVLALALLAAGGQDEHAAVLSAADAYHEQALMLVGQVLRQSSLRSLQAVLLLLLYSIVNPQKPVVWHVLGSAQRLASSLRLHEKPATESAETRLGQRLIRCLYSMDRAIGHTLGRPPMLADHVIARDVFSTSPSSSSAPTFRDHCLQLRQLQSQAADCLYQRTRRLPAGGLETLQVQADRWWAEAAGSQSVTKREADWLEHSYYNYCMFIRRPSPANPTPPPEDLQRCFDAASHVLAIYARLHLHRQLGAAMDSTWMAVHWLFLAAVTHLFCLWTDDSSADMAPSVRRTADWNRVNEDIQATGMVLSAMTERWKSGRKMLSIYRRLSRGTLRKYAVVQAARQDALPSQHVREPVHAGEPAMDVPQPGQMSTLWDGFVLSEAMMLDPEAFWLGSEQTDYSLP